jgi:hypothetical protein
MSAPDSASGPEFVFAAAKKPLTPALADTIGRLVAQVPGIREAYVPQYRSGDGEFRQGLVIGVEKKEEIPAIVADLTARMQRGLPPGAWFDILPFAAEAIPAAARAQRCHIYGELANPWWRFWR